MQQDLLSYLAREGSGIGGLFIVIIYLGVIGLVIASFWKVFEKAGKPGWAAIVPIYNIIVMLEIVKRPTWWVVLYLIPVVSFVAAIIVAMDMAEAFGKSKGWGVGMLVFLMPVGYAMLAFGDASYSEPADKT